MGQSEPTFAGAVPPPIAGSGTEALARAPPNCASSRGAIAWDGLMRQRRRTSTWFAHQACFARSQRHAVRARSLDRCVCAKEMPVARKAVGWFPRVYSRVPNAQQSRPAHCLSEPVSSAVSVPSNRA